MRRMMTMLPMLAAEDLLKLGLVGPEDVDRLTLVRPEDREASAGAGPYDWPGSAGFDYEAVTGYDDGTNNVQLMHEDGSLATAGQHPFSNVQHLHNLVGQLHAQGHFRPAPGHKVVALRAVPRGGHPALAGHPAAHLATFAPHPAAMGGLGPHPMVHVNPHGAAMAQAPRTLMGQAAEAQSFREYPRLAMVTFQALAVAVGANTTSIAGYGQQTAPDKFLLTGLSMSTLVADNFFVTLATVGGIPFLTLSGNEMSLGIHRPDSTQGTLQPKVIPPGVPIVLNAVNRAPAAVGTLDFHLDLVGVPLNDENCLRFPGLRSYR